MTLEEAQEKIIELTEQVNTLTQERDNLTESNNTLTADNESLRSLNQKYFNKLIAQDVQDNGDGQGDGDDVAPTCEEFASSINI